MSSPSISSLRLRTVLAKLSLSAILLTLLGSSVVVMTAPGKPQRTETQCVSEGRARKYAESSPLPDYPEEQEPGSSAGRVFVAVEFGTDGKFSKMKMHETPGPQVTEAVKSALEKWQLKKLFDGGGQPIKTRTALRFHFVFEDGKGRVDVATEQEQLEFGGHWSKPVCRVIFDESVVLNSLRQQLRRLFIRFATRPSDQFS